MRLISINEINRNDVYTLFYNLVITQGSENYCGTIPWDCA